MTPSSSILMICFSSYRSSSLQVGLVTRCTGTVVGLGKIKTESFYGHVNRHTVCRLHLQQALTCMTRLWNVKHCSFPESSPSLGHSLEHDLDLKSIIPIKRPLKEHATILLISKPMLCKMRQNSQKQFSFLFLS